MIARRTVLKLAVGGMAVGAVAPSVVPSLALASDVDVLRQAAQSFGFDVFLSGNHIGRHDVSFTPVGDGTEVVTHIDLSVKLAFLNLYHYRHESGETWRHDRLRRVWGRTDRNGRRFAFEGIAEKDAIRLEGSQGSFDAALDDRTSNNLWHPSVLGRSSVIDAQYGGVIGLRAKLESVEQISMAGDRVRASRYTIDTPHIIGSLWYDDSEAWVKARFKIKAGILEYRLQA